MTESPREPDDARDERIRLLEYQLDYLRAELSQLVGERDKMVYSASWHIFSPLRRIEARLVDAASALWRRLVPPA
ncbi:MAG: glycosyltransferase family 1 protein, partial [Methylocystis sp.]